MIESIEAFRVDGRWIVPEYEQAQEIARMLSLGRAGEAISIEALYQGEWQALPPLEWSFASSGSAPRPHTAPPPGFF